jgi:predicted RNA-binding Zn-ribbon protein involved in translation (DUF1610 family)
VARPAGSREDVRVGQPVVAVPDERRCWTCDDAMAVMVEDGISRWVCPTCGPKERRGRRPRTQRGMRAGRASEQMSYGDRHRRV